MKFSLHADLFSFNAISRRFLNAESYTDKQKQLSIVIKRINHNLKITEKIYEIAGDCNSNANILITRIN